MKKKERRGTGLHIKCIIAMGVLLMPLGNGKVVAQTASKSPDARIKNVLFIVSDDLKANVLGCYGNMVCKTPNIDKLAREGVVFNRAYCQGVVCAPSRTSFMYSRYQGNTGITLGEHFKDKGWHTARVGKIFHMLVPGDIIAGTDGKDVVSSWTERYNSAGLEAGTPGDYACLNLNIFTTELEGRQSTRMPHRWSVSVNYEGDGSDQPDYKTADKTIELLRKNKDKPFFIATGFVRPHYPSVAPKPYFDRYPWEDIQLPKVVAHDIDDIPPMGRPKKTNATDPIGKYTDNQKRMWAAYYATVTFMDDQVGRILEELERLGLRESTAIVFLSDHGYHLGEHTFWLKSNLHEDITRVPLIISIPGMETGKTDAFVELLDIYPTLASWAGISIPETVQGTNLLPVLQDLNSSVKSGAISMVGGDKGIALREADFAYMRYQDGSEELYDMEKDPLQFVNLANYPEYERELQQIRNNLDLRIQQEELQFRTMK
ncbi:MAG: sulfatase [Bacteroidota bacterium]